MSESCVPLVAAATTAAATAGLPGLPRNGRLPRRPNAATTSRRRPAAGNEPDATDEHH